MRCLVIEYFRSQAQEKEAEKKHEGKVHNDMWQLNMRPCISGGNPTWERVRVREDSG